MAAFLYGRLVTDHEYVQRVRQQRPSALLPVIAAASARWNHGTWWNSPFRKYTPWALADVARVSLGYGNEHRGDGTCTEKDLLSMLAAYASLTDLMIRDNGSAESVSSWFLRVSGEQFSFQEFGFSDLARTAALFDQTSPARTPACLVDGWDEELLGCSLSDYVGVTQLLQVSALRNEGRFDPAWLNQPQMEKVCSVIPDGTIREVTERHFVTDQEAFRAENEARRLSRDPHLRRFEYNPLRGRPFLSGFGRGYLAPSSHLIAPKGSPLGLYYMGVNHFGDVFAQELGDLFEQYIGRQLRQLPNAEVHSEIIYRDERRSVDWIVVFDDLVLLVEVKSTRPTQQLRLGVLDRTNAALRQIKHAYKQVETTAALIASKDPNFSHIPANRPVQGLVVTMEPFHTANAPFQKEMRPDTDTPITVCSAAELENLVTLQDLSASQLLIGRLADPRESTYSLDTAFRGKNLARNAILDAGWDSYPWKRHADLGRGTAAGSRVV
ncbi:hypothetical protein [Streptomyces sp. ITFR-16]|uniref:hypothetical protein n=1 Tax=Streptomyces sp. ITFR-16 TaxID=3075198 RepID=UPI00288ABCDC|nr:hypothetical protein [Streptomyces sp. ITFR-16]WNI27349.1 hypothetical protein RLT58_36025 [Streptomyces sp. ITFR-16]